jgi:hypothetical protein
MVADMMGGADGMSTQEPISENAVRNALFSSSYSFGKKFRE